MAMRGGSNPPNLSRLVILKGIILMDMDVNSYRISASCGKCSTASSQTFSFCKTQHGVIIGCRGCGFKKRMQLPEYPGQVITYAGQGIQVDIKFFP